MFIGDLVFIGCLVLALLGVLSTLINLPGGWLVALATLLYGMWSDYAYFSVTAVVVYFIIALLSTFLDNVVMLLGAKKMGASKWGMLGAFIGGILGLIFFGPIGVIFGPFVGAVIAESIFAGKEGIASLKAGLGAFIGFILGLGLRMGITVGMTIYWVVVLSKGNYS